MDKNAYVWSLDFLSVWVSLLFDIYIYSLAVNETIQYIGLRAI